MTSQKTLKLALLVCDTPIPSVVSTSGDYPVIFKEHLRKSIPSNSALDFTLDSFDVVHKQEYPTLDQEDTYEGVIYTGSGLSLQMIIDNHSSCMALQLLRLTRMLNG